MKHQRTRHHLAVLLTFVFGSIVVGCGPRNQGPEVAVGPPPKIKLAEVEGVVTFACSPDGKLLAVSFDESTNTRIGIWDLATGEQQTEMDEPKGTVLVAFTPDGQKLVGFAEVRFPALRFPRDTDPKNYHEFKLWDALSGKVIRASKLPEFPAHFVDWSLLSFTDDKTACVFRGQRLVTFKVENGEVATGNKHEQLINPTVYAPKTGLFGFVGDNRQHLEWYKPSEMGPSHKAALQFEARSLAVSQDGKTLALSYNETGELSPKKMFGRTELWDVASWKLRSTLPAADPKEFLTYDQLLLSADGKYLAGLAWHPSEAKESQIDIWDTSGKKLNTLKLPGMIGDLRWIFTPDGKTLITAFRGGRTNTGLKIFENVQAAAKNP